MTDELQITKAARRRLEPWFDSDRELEQWAAAQVERAADAHRLLKTPPRGWPGITVTRAREHVFFVESDGHPTDAVLQLEVFHDRVKLHDAYTRAIDVNVTRHARERLAERVDQLEPNREKRRHWLNATVDMALRAESLTLEAPSWCASAPLRPGFGWTTRKLNGEEIALLVAAPHRKGGSWNIVTVLSRSTAISPWGRLVRVWKRGSRLVTNRIKYRSAPPVRKTATRPPRLGDVSPAPYRNHRRQRSSR